MLWCCMLSVDVTTGWMLLYQAGRRATRTVFLTAVAAQRGGTQHVVKELSETGSTSVALKRNHVSLIIRLL